MKDYILELDKPRELRFGFRSHRLIQSKFGERGMDQLQNIKMHELPALAWCGLKAGDNSLTVEQVEDMLDDAIPERYTVMDATVIILEALAAHLGVDVSARIAELKEIADPKKAPAGEMEEVKAAEKKPQPKRIIPSSKKQKK